MDDRVGQHLGHEFVEDARQEITHDKSYSGPPAGTISNFPGSTPGRIRQLRLGLRRGTRGQIPHPDPSAVAIERPSRGIETSWPAGTWA